LDVDGAVDDKLIDSICCRDGANPRLAHPVLIDVTYVEDGGMKVTSSWFGAILVDNGPKRNQMHDIAVEVLGLHDD